MKALAIFKPGSHTTMSGDTLTFSEADVAAIAAAYNPNTHNAPLVIGHPKDNSPAYGWTKSLNFANGLLQAIPEVVTPEFADWVNKGFYKKISAAFYPPESPSNPRPGVYYLRHIGFLGAMPPAIKGMPDAAFSEQHGFVSIAFADMGVTEPNNAEMARRARDYRTELSEQGIYVSFAEAVDAVNAMRNGQNPSIEVTRRINAYIGKAHSQGRAISFCEAVDAVNAGHDLFENNF